MTPAERHTPSEGAVREQLREHPGPRASSSPAEGRETPREEADGGAPADGAAPSEADGAANAGGAGSEAPAEGGGGDAAPQPDLQAESTPDPLAEAERERDEYLALAQRTQAEFENFRRRAARDAAAVGARAKAGLVRELLPAIDNLERALAAVDPAEDEFARGVQMVHGELVAALERSGVAAFSPAGEPFDPTVHEALSTRPADGAEPGVVLDVVEKGYRLDDTVLRPARVVVSA